jgi:peptide chain release factor 1
LQIEGKDLSGLNKEAGGIRIQRIPPTERKGRVHSSTCTLAVMDGNVKTNPLLALRNSEHFSIEWFSGTGAGGQHRNKKQCSVRYVHIPTGTTEIRQGRSRDSNLREAKEALLQKLNLMARIESGEIFAGIRKDQVGSGMRGDKARTIRFQDDIVIDHGTGKRISAEKYMRGHMNLLW